MSELTAEELLDYRQQAGDNSETPLLEDDQIQKFYDKSVSFGDDDEQTEARTIVYMLRRMLGDAVKLVDLGGEIEINKRSQKFDHIQEVLLPYWEGKAGMQGGGILKAGSLDMGIDADEDDCD